MYITHKQARAILAVPEHSYRVYFTCLDGVTDRIYTVEEFDELTTEVEFKAYKVSFTKGATNV